MAEGSQRGAQVFLGLFLLIGIGIIGVGFGIMFKSLRTNRWPMTEGVIESAQIQANHSDEGRSYCPKVTYTYHVAGIAYDGTKIAIGQMSSSSDYAQGVLDRYPVGRKVTVHYSPTDPAEAVLEPGIHGGTWICFGVGGAFTLVSIALIQAIRAANKSPQPADSVASNKPPVLVGLVFLLAGIAICFAPPSGGTPKWIVCAAGAMFGFAGIFILLQRLENKSYSNLAMCVAMALLLAIFHWVSFGPGERLGTSTTPFTEHHNVNVRWPFAIFTGIADLILLAALARWLLKRIRG